MLIFFLFSNRVQISKTEYKYGQSYCRYFFVLAIRNYILFISVLRLGCSVSSFRIKKFSLIFNRFSRINVSIFVWCSSSISINFACVLKLYPSMSDWLDAALLSFLVIFFLWLLSLLLNSVSDFPTFCSCSWNFAKVVCSWKAWFTIITF